MRTLYLHIGIHRTGTTAIQRALHANREALKQQGFHYALNSENHTWLAHEIDHSGESADVAVQRLIDDSRASSANAVIVSGEDLCRVRNVGRLSALKSDFKVQVICYLRRQDAWLESWYNQHIRWPWDPDLSTLTPEEFLARRGEFFWLDYAALLAPWREVFSEASVIVRPYERPQLDISVVEDFCRLCGIHFEALTLRKATQNASAPARALTILRLLNLYGKQGAQRARLIAGVNGAVISAGLGVERHVFSARVRRNIVLQHAGSNSAVAKQYLNRDDGALFLEAAPEDDPTPPELSLPPMPNFAARIAKPLVGGYLRDIVAALSGSTATAEEEQERLRLLRERTHWLERQRRTEAVLGSRAALLRRLWCQMWPWTDVEGHATLHRPETPAAGQPGDGHSLPQSAGELLRLLDFGDLDPRTRAVLMESLRAWRPLGLAASGADLQGDPAPCSESCEAKSKAMSPAAPADPEDFTRLWLEPLLDILGHRLANAQKMAEQSERAASSEIQGARRQLSSLETKVVALEGRIATPVRTAATLLRLLRDRS